MTPKPPTELQLPIYGVTKAIGPKLLPYTNNLTDCFKEAFSCGYF
jgi:hypothetical protein